MPWSSTGGEQAELVQRWMRDQLPSSLADVQTESTDNGVVLHLEEELQFDTFIQAVHGVKIEDPRFEDVHLEVRDIEGNKLSPDADAINVYEVQDLGNGSLAQFKVGKTYHRTDTISLGHEPIGPDGEPVDDVIENTLFHLSLYLAQK